MSLPLVSCICPTTEARRGKWFSEAVSCFVDQDYPNLEFVVAADTEHYASLNGNSLRYGVKAICGKWRTLGEKRNAACSIASGDIIAHWDDDDYSAPTRISHQVKTLLESGKSVTGFKSMKFVDEAGAWWQYNGGNGDALGTSLCYLRSWWLAHQFDSVNVGEDTNFTSRAIRERQLHPIADIGLMYATMHKGNTCQRTPNIRGNTTWKALPGFQWPS